MTEAPFGEQVIYAVLGNLTANHLTAILEIAGLRFGFTCAEPHVLELFQRICAPYTVSVGTRPDVEFSPYQLEAIADVNRVQHRCILGLLGQRSTQLQGRDSALLRLTHGAICTSPVGMNVSLEIVGRVKVFSLEKTPELSLPAGLRMALLAYYSTRFRNLTIFHASAIVHKPTGTTIILSSQDALHVGKTTLALATVLQESSDFALVADDDVVLGLDGQGELVHLPFPAAVTIRQGTLQAIRHSGIALPLEPHIFTDKYGPIHSLAFGSIATSGFGIATPQGHIAKWVEVSLGLTQEEYAIAKLSPETALADFVGSVRIHRMVQQRTPFVQSEVILSTDHANYCSILQNTSQLHRTLTAQGCQFYSLRGGMNRMKLYSLMQNLVEL